MLGLDQVGGQPGEQQIELPGVAELADGGAPERSSTQKFAIAGAGGLDGLRRGRLERLTRRPEPGPQPEQRQGAQAEEHRPPAVVGQHQPPHQGAAGRSQAHGHGDQAVTAPTHLLGGALGQDAGVGRIDDALAQPHRQPQPQQTDEAGGQAAQHGRARPYGQGYGQHPPDVEALDDRAGQGLGQGVGPEEAGQQDAHLGVAELHAVVQHRGDDRQAAPIGVVDEHGQGQEHHNPARQRPAPSFRLLHDRSPRHRQAILVLAAGQGQARAGRHPGRAAEPGFPAALSGQPIRRRLR